MKGKIWLPEVVEEKSIEVKSIANYLNIPFLLVNSVGGIEEITFTELKDDYVCYVLKHSWEKISSCIANPGTKIDRLDGIQINYYTAEGMELQGIPSSASSISRKPALIFQQKEKFLQRQFAEDTYAIIKYPTKTKIVEVPFEFKNIQLP